MMCDCNEMAFCMRIVCVFVLCFFFWSIVAVVATHLTAEKAIKNDSTDIISKQTNDMMEWDDEWPLQLKCVNWRFVNQFTSNFWPLTANRHPISLRFHSAKSLLPTIEFYITQFKLMVMVMRAVMTTLFSPIQRATNEKSATSTCYIYLINAKWECPAIWCVYSLGIRDHQFERRTKISAKSNFKHFLLCDPF